jgi:hypothetical protein
MEIQYFIMRKSFLNYMLQFVFIILLITAGINCTIKTVLQNGTKADPSGLYVHQVQGLWTGTYTAGAGQAVPAGTEFYFSFSIYPDSTLHYKSKGYHNGRSDYITFADGTWSLAGTTFTFNVTTVNLPVYGAQHTQAGTATFNSSNGTLTNGTIADLNKPGNGATWSMSRVH